MQTLTTLEFLARLAVGLGCGAGSRQEGNSARWPARAYHVVLIRPTVAGSRGCDTMTRRRGQAGPQGSAEHVNTALAERLADTMFALSTPSRVLILECLLTGPRSVSDITEALGMEQSAVSHQLRVLREHQLVRADRAGRMRLYALYDDDVSVLLEAGLRHVDPGRARPAADEGVGAAS
jgi:ArsR family transcriptional regulator, nickel/cobalt-responsive transcriptional repressor